MPTRPCPNCRYELPPERATCPECGTSSQEGDPTMSMAAFVFGAIKIIAVPIVIMIGAFVAMHFIRGALSGTAGP